MTQFGATFTPVFITTDGSQFGTFAGVTISVDGLVTALFDNGETRPVYKIPIATFTNVNALEGRTATFGIRPKPLAIPHANRTMVQPDRSFKQHR